MSSSSTAEIAPGGRLRLAVPVGPAASATWCVPDAATGKPVGVAVDLGIELGRRAGMPVDVLAYASSGAIVQAAATDAWDLTFIPADAERKKHVAFGPNYFLSESTYLVPADAGIADIAGVDRPGLVAVGIENTATLRSVRRTLTQASIVGVSGFEEAVALFETGQADAVALSRETLNNLLPQLKRPAVILDGNFHTAGNALAVPLDRAPAAEALGKQLEAVKADGTMAAIFAGNGLAHLDVAPAGSRP